MQTHLAREVRERHLSIGEFDSEERVREGLIDDSFYDLFISHICAK